MTSREDKCFFFNLPREIRDKIYTHLVSKWTTAGQIDPPERCFVRHAGEIEKRILAASRQCHDEALPIFYGLNHFHLSNGVPRPASGAVDYPFDILRFVIRVGASNATLVQNISVEIPMQFPQRHMYCERTGNSRLRLESVKCLRRLMQPTPEGNGGRFEAMLQLVQQADEISQLFVRPLPGSYRWIWRWRYDRQFVHLWYVSKDFKSKKWVSPVLHRNSTEAHATRMLTLTNSKDTLWRQMAED